MAIDYLFVDASHFKMHDSPCSEPALVAYGITTEGNSILLHLECVRAPSTDACVGFLLGMVARGLGSPALPTSALGPLLEELAGDGLRGRPDETAVRAGFWDSFDIDDEHAPGHAAVGEARRRARQFDATWGKAYPGAIATVIDGLDELVAHLYYPRPHWPRIRHTNLSGPSARPAAGSRSSAGSPGGRSAPSLLFAVLERAAGGWRGITYAPADVRLLQMIRRDLGLIPSRKEQPEADPIATSQTSPSVSERNRARGHCWGIPRVWLTVVVRVMLLLRGWGW